MVSYLRLPPPPRECILEAPRLALERVLAPLYPPLRLPLPIALRLLLPAGRDMSRLPTRFELLAPEGRDMSRVPARFALLLAAGRDMSRVPARFAAPLFLALGAAERVV